MSKFLQRVGSPYAINWVGITFVVFLQFPAAFIASRANYSGRVVIFIAIDILIHIALSGVLLLGRFLRLKLGYTSANAILNLAIVLVAIICRAWIFDTLLMWSHITNESRLAYRILSGTPSILVILVITALLTSNSAQYQKQNLELVALAEGQLVEKKNTAIEIELYRTKLVNQVESEITQALSGWEDIPSASKASFLENLLTEVIRPLSHRIADSGEPQGELESDEFAKGFPWYEVIKSTLDGLPFHPMFTTIWAGSITFGYIFATFQSLGIVLLVAILVAGYLYLYFWARIWTNFTKKLKFLSKTILFIVLSFAYGSLHGVILNFFLMDSKSPIFIDLVMGFALAPIVIITGLAKASTRILQDVNQKLEMQLFNLQRETVQLQAVKAALRKNIARTVHGPIQDAIAALMLSLKTQDLSLDSPKEISKISQQIKEALLAASTNSSNTRALREYLFDTSEIWSDLAKIEIDISENDLDLINHDWIAKNSVIEIVREACSNAVRHADATHIKVTIVVDVQTQTVCLTVVNNGRQYSPNSIQGLGSQTFNELAMRWNISAAGDQTKLIAELPVDLELTVEHQTF